MVTSFDFRKLESLPEVLKWLFPPESFEMVRKDGLKIMPAAKTDFWQKTYYNPPIEKCIGPVLTLEMPWSCEQWCVETQFTLNPINQFDQAGIMIFIDDLHWLKAGIECVDREPKMSCVVTNGKSDWSTQPWKGVEEVSIRVSYMRESFVVQCKLKDKWELIRISHISSLQKTQPLRAGVYCCAPTAGGMSAVFHSLTITDTVTFDHHAS